ncbi:MAG TPA: zf-HC2 domain-containing protein [Vicinamibacterales bacterium]|jgi:anti-sigma factor RsiW|nr:zf-HC2 domain-containing protein [Vicinamibacterales bacterium]
MSEIACVSGVDLLMDYLEGALAADVRAALDAHVAGCERCVAFIESYRATPRILKQVTAASLPADVQQSLRTFLRSQGLVPPGDW